MEQNYDAVDQIMAYEQGELDDDETTRLFQHLVDTGLAWSLQGSYGRTATDMILAGLITNPEDGLLPCGCPELTFKDCGHQEGCREYRR
jgi:hypothetical protein